MKLLSVVVPCYNEEESVELFYRELLKNTSFLSEKDMKLELIYIDDGSQDCIILMVGGIQFFCTGILGQYLAKTYMEVKKRPIYIVKENTLKY